MADEERTLKAASLRELPREIAPPRDLWPAIEAALEPRSGARAPGRSRWSPGRGRLLALAATIAALAVGIWIGRSGIPDALQMARRDAAPAGTTAEGSGFMPAAYVSDPRYVNQRNELLSALEGRLAALPPESRAKVAASLATLHRSMKELEAALGKDPSNALLQELLVNTYQDEMRVLTAVHEASSAGEEI